MASFALIIMTSTLSPATRFRPRAVRDPREDILFSELELSIRWNRPSLLFAVYDSQETRRQVTRRLTRRLKRLGQRCVNFSITPARADIPLALLSQPAREQTVFMVYSLRQAGVVFTANPYKSLNIRRENLVEARIRAVFWLTEAEAVQIARLAPDFWAFRHRVVDFLSTSVSGSMPGGLPPADLDAKITYRQQLLDDLESSTWPDAYNLNLSLGNLYSQKADLQQAVAHLAAAANLAQSVGDSSRQFNALLSLGIVLGQGGQLEAAFDALQQAAACNPSSPLPQMQMSALHLSTGQADAALHQARQCVQQFPHDSQAWTHLGWVLGALGYFDTAFEACQRVLTLNADDARAWYQLGMLHSMRAETSLALAPLERACRLDDACSLYWHAFGIQLDDSNQPDRALACARRAVRLEMRDATAWLGLGAILQKRRRFKAALACYENGLYWAGLNATLAVLAHLSMAQIWQLKRKPLQSQAACAQALASLPRADALGRAAYYAFVGDAPQAQSALSLAWQTSRWQAHLLRKLPVVAALL